NSSSHYEVAMSACESYTWPLSGQIYSSSGSYNYIIPNAAGCDSVITLQLSVHNPYFFESDLSVCDSLFWPATGETYFSSEQLSYYSTSVNGCDSTLILNLTVNESAHTSTDISACDSYSWPVNGENYTSDGVYTDVFTNSQGCDSSFTLNLSVNQSFLNTIEEKTCEPYYWPVSDEVYSETGLYTFNFISSTSCDSTFILNLEVEPIEITIQPEDVYVEVGNTATFAIQTEFQDTEYQWQIKGSEGFIDLENIAPYMGVTTELLEIKVVTPAQANAQFRCIVSNQACEEISQVAELKVSTLNASIYPNPNDGKFTLAIPEELIGSMAKVYDDQGKLVLKSIIENQFTEFDMYYLASGIYQVVIPEIETLRFIILR
ncbi:MAG TPA: T9SS type A sorting domain-containing protein, partial [Marinilabiliaceae bacterium]|nr:T9SS type A sorting domain-containing protein [Marinilabiliaceae bacterium]